MIIITHNEYEKVSGGVCIPLFVIGAICACIGGYLSSSGDN